MQARLTHIGGSTLLIEVGGWRILTDPTFDPPGGKYRFGWGTGSQKLTGPALAASELGPLDAILLSHDQHEDNLDAAGRALLPGAAVVVTTRAGAKRLGANAVGLGPWQGHRLEAEGKPAIEISATPCRHGPPLVTGAIVGEVTGFSLAWEGQREGSFWISGDTVLYPGVREVPKRLKVGTAVVHLGGVSFPVSGPLRYTMNGREAIELCELVGPATTIPIHYEGWKHFREGRDAVEAAFAAAPESVRGTLRWLPIGEPSAVDV